MYKFMKVLSIVLAVACVIMGLTFTFKPYKTLNSAMRIVGIIAAIGCAMHVADYFKNGKKGGGLTSAAGELALAIAFLFFPGKIMGFVGEVCGIMLLGGAVLVIYKIYKIGAKPDRITLCLAIAAAVLGAAMLFGAFNPAAVALRIVGIALIVYGVDKIYGVLKTDGIF